MVVTRMSKQEIPKVRPKRNNFSINIGKWKITEDNHQSNDVISTNNPVLFKKEKKLFNSIDYNPSIKEFNTAFYNGVLKELIDADICFQNDKKAPISGHSYHSIPPKLDNSDNPLLYNMYFPSSIIQTDKVDTLRCTNSSNLRKDDVYLKLRMHKSFMRKYQKVLLELIPENFCFSGYMQMPIVFYNTHVTVCETHYDMDNSILYLVAGTKEILLNTKANVLKQYSSNIEDVSTSGYYDDIKPFEETDEERRANGWKLCVLRAGDSLYIPKNIVHCVLSKKKSLAISFQVTNELPGSRALFAQKQYTSMINYLNK